MLNIVLDLLVIFTLVVTVGFTFVLNKKLTMMYKNKAELQIFIQQFTQSLSQAEKNISNLKGVGESVFKTAQAQFDKATILKDDLVFLLERGEEIAQKLEQGIKEGRGINKAQAEISTMLYDVKESTISPNVTPLPTVNTMHSFDNSDQLLKRLKNVR